MVGPQRAVAPAGPRVLPPAPSRTLSALSAVISLRDGRLSMSSSRITRTWTPRRQAAISVLTVVGRSRRNVEMWMTGCGCFRVRTVLRIACSTFLTIR